MVRTRHLGRLLLGLVTLLALATGARAQSSTAVTAVTDLSASNSYYITTNSTFVSRNLVQNESKNAFTGTGIAAYASSTTTGNTVANGDYSQFAFLASPSHEGDYYIFNVSFKKYVTATKVASWVGSYSLGMETTPSIRYAIKHTSLSDDLLAYPFLFVCSSNSNYMTQAAATSPYYYLTADDTSKTEGENNRFAITEASTMDATALTTALTAIETTEGTTYLTQLQSVVTEASAIKQGTTVGTYSGISDADYTALQTALATAQTAISESSQSKAADALPALRAALATVKASASLNMPTDGTFLRVRANSQTGNPYLYGTAYSTSVNSKLNMGTDGSTSESIFYYKDGHLLCYNNGYYLYCPKISYNGQLALAQGDSISITPSTFTFTASSVTGAYIIQYTGYMASYAECTRKLYAQYKDNAYYSDCIQATGTATQCDFNLINVTELPVTIKDTWDGYATFYTPVGLTYDTSKLTAYTGKLEKRDDGTYLVLTDLQGKIPAGQPVVLYATTAGTYSMTIDSSVSGEVVGDLKGQVNTILASSFSNPCTLQKIDNQVGFYSYTGTNLTGFKARLSLAKEGTNVRGFIFDDGSTTGINAVGTSKTSDENVYDLQGRRVSKATRGLYIIGGKKVLVK